jgi:hypothetical protein
MKRSKPTRREPSPDAIVAALSELGVDFVMCQRRVYGARLAARPAALLAGLVQQDEARLRLSLIPLMLRHPEFAAAAPKAMRKLNSQQGIYLKLYYTAAVLLQEEHAERLQSTGASSAPIVDWFSEELGVPLRGNPVERLRVLGKKHQKHSGIALNWQGTYEHALERYIKHAEAEREWARLRPTPSAC